MLHIIFFHNNQTNKDGTGFFPGQASLAYFFFLGSSGSSNWASRLARLAAAEADKFAGGGNIGGAAMSIWEKQNN